MPPHHTSAVPRAVILAAGNGDRFRGPANRSKLLTPVAGTPLLLRTLLSVRRAGLTHAHLILGFDADRVRALALAGAPAGLTLRFCINKDWHEENGVSVLAARPELDGHSFALLMGDHLFEAQMLRDLLAAPRFQGETLLGIDRQATTPQMAAEATKVRLTGAHVTEIGKAIDPYDAFDTGLFVCHSSIFAALEESRADGDTTLSGGIARLAAKRLVRAVDVGHARWCDIDTVDDLAAAERLLRPASGL
jgi:choline kinase